MNNTPAKKAALRLRKIYGGDCITLETVERVISEEYRDTVEALECALSYATHPVHGNNAHAASVSLKVRSVIEKLNGKQS